MEHPHRDPELTHAPVLASLHKEDPFVVPEGFFDHFPHHVQAVVNASSPRRRLLPVFPAWRLAFALPMLVLAGIGAWWLRSTGMNATDGPELEEAHWSVPVLPADIDESVVLAYIDDNGDELSDLGAVDVQLNDEELLAYLEAKNTDLYELTHDLR